MLEPNVGTKCWNQMLEPNILIVSSLLFITNAVSALYKKYYVYSFLFGYLTLSSLLFHTSNTIYTNIIDKCCITAIVVYGGYMLYNKTTKNQINLFLIVLSFLGCIFFFFYGYYVNEYCYHPDKYVGDTFHCMLHLISSFGHHLIIFL